MVALIVFSYSNKTIKKLQYTAKRHLGVYVLSGPGLVYFSEELPMTGITKYTRLKVPVIIVPINAFIPTEFSGYFFPY